MICFCFDNVATAVVLAAAAAAADDDRLRDFVNQQIIKSAPLTQHA